jgi:hypothetical protein
MRRHLSYANIVATLALIFAMSGGALAASRYLLHSTRQISPGVLKALKGRTGKRGLAGNLGPVGPQGIAGPPGGKGPKGEQGKDGPAGFSPSSPLPSGQSESGDYGARMQASTAGAFSESITFPQHLEAPIPALEVVYTNAAEAPHCKGPGQADKGYLCIYSLSSGALEGPPTVSNLETSSPATGAGRLGFELTWVAKAGGEAHDAGTYTVTAK